MFSFSNFARAHSSLVWAQSYRKLAFLHTFQKSTFFNTKSNSFQAQVILWKKECMHTFSRTCATLPFVQRVVNLKRICNWEAQQVQKCAPLNLPHFNIFVHIFNKGYFRRNWVSLVQLLRATTVQFFAKVALYYSSPHCVTLTGMRGRFPPPPPLVGTASTFRTVSIESASSTWPKTTCFTDMSPD